MYIELDTKPSEADIQSLQARQLFHSISAVIREVGEIVGGAYCYLASGWLYVDTLWVSESTRGKGYGTLIMNALETYALQENLSGIYLFTADFQARPFYERLGYQVFGEEHGRPPGHILYYLSKTALTEKPIDPRVELLTKAAPEIYAILDENIMQHAAAYAPIEAETLAVFLRDEDGTIRGGLYGEIYWNWFDLWWALDDSLGEWADQLLETLEAECRRRSALGLVTHTHTHTELLQKRGYIAFTTLPDCPPNGVTSYLHKRLVG